MSLRLGFPQGRPISSPSVRGLPRAGFTAQPGTPPKQNCPLSGWKRPRTGALSPLSDQGLPLGGAEAAPSGNSSLIRGLTLLKLSPVRRCAWSPLPPACHFPGIPEIWLARDSPTTGKGRGINMGLPLAGTKAAFLLQRRWMLVPGKAGGFSSPECRNSS